MKKSKLIISIIMLVLFFIVGIIVYINKLPTEPLSEEQINELLKKADSIENISIKTIDKGPNNNVREIILNKKAEVTRTDSKSKNNYTIAWKNSKTNEWIMIEENDKVWFKIQQDEKQEDIKFRFIKYEKYNKSKCAVIENTWTGENIDVDGRKTVIITTRMWVDLKTGVTLKIENNSDDGEKYESYSTVTLNKVKDEDVAKPNLDGYTEYDINQDKLNNVK